MGHMGTSRYSPNYVVWEALSQRLVGQFLQTPDTGQDTNEKENDRFIMYTLTFCQLISTINCDINITVI